MAPNPALPWPPAAPSKGIDPETSSPYGAPLFGAGTGGIAVPGSAAKAPNEFSRIVTPDRLGAPKLVESFEASPAERAAVARRLATGRAHVCTPVTNAHLVCRLLLEQ